MAEDKWVYHLRSFGVGSELMKESTRDAIVKRQRDLQAKMGKGDLGIPGATTYNTAPITKKDIAKTIPEKKVGQFQTKGKQTLLTKQPVKRKGGGGSPGGGGKWGWFNRMKHSPWNLLKNDKSY